MPYVSKDISINELGRFKMVQGVDNTSQKIDKFFVPKLKVFVGTKTEVPYGTAIGVVRIIDYLRGQYFDLQDRVVNSEYYEDDDTVVSIDQIEAKKLTDTRVSFSFRVLLGEKALKFEGTV